MLSQDDTEDCLGQPGLKTPDDIATQGNKRTPYDATCTATPGLVSAGHEAVHGAQVLKSSGKAVAAHTDAKSRKRSRANSAQASEKQALGTGLFSSHFQASVVI